MVKTKEIKEKFIEDFWRWFKNYHEERYEKEGRMLSPSFKHHSKFMKFDNYAWDWVALFVEKEFIKRNKEVQLR